MYISIKDYVIGRISICNKYVISMENYLKKNGIIQMKSFAYCLKKQKKSFNKCVYIKGILNKTKFVNN